MERGDVILIVDRRDPSSASDDPFAKTAAGGPRAVRINLPAAEEARRQALSTPAYPTLVGDEPSVRAHAMFAALGAADVGGASLRARLRYAGVGLWQFMLLPLYVPLRKAIEVVEVCHRLLCEYQPRQVILCGAGDPSDHRWRHALETLSAAAGIPWTDATRGASGSPVGHRAPRPRVPRLTVGAGEWLVRRVGWWLSHVAALRERNRWSAGSPLVIVSWSRHWTRVFDPASGAARLGDEQFDPIVDAARARGFTHILGLDVFGGYRRHGSSFWHTVTRDFPDGLRTLMQRLLGSQRVRWRTFHYYTPPAARRRLRENRRWLASLAAEVLTSPAVAAALTHRDVGLLPIVRGDLAGALGAHAAECTLSLDTARAFIQRIGPAAIVLTNEDHPAVTALVAEGARAAVPTVLLQDAIWGPGRYARAPESATTRISEDSQMALIPMKTCVWGEATKHILLRDGGYPPDAVAVTGNWRYDPFLSAPGRVSRERLCASLGLDPRATIAVLATPDQPESPALALWVVRALRAYPEYQLVVKTHPGQDSDPYARMLAREGTGRERLITGRLYEILLVAAVVITEVSTVAMEALLLGKPVVETSLSVIPRHGYAGSGVGLGVPPDGDLVAALRRALTDPPTIAELAARRRAFIAEYLGVADGRAAERVLDVVGDLLVQRAPCAPAAAHHAPPR